MDTIPCEQSEAPAYHASRRFLLPTFAIIWFCAVGTGMSWMWEYESTPGPEALPGSQWPSDSSIARSEELPTLVLFAHPRCPCTRATMRELELIVAHCTQKLDVQVIFFRPEGASGGWERTDIWAAAEALPGVTVICDEGGQEAKRFDATTSGFALLFDRWGNLLFSGGITGSRGHSGDNAGRTSIETLVMTGMSERKDSTFVFGCPLLGQDDVCSEECQP